MEAPVLGGEHGKPVIGPGEFFLLIAELLFGGEKRRRRRIKRPRPQRDFDFDRLAVADGAQLQRTPGRRRRQVQPEVDDAHNLRAVEPHDHIVRHNPAGSGRAARLDLAHDHAALALKSERAHFAVGKLRDALAFRAEPAGRYRPVVIDHAAGHCVSHEFDRVNIGATEGRILRDANHLTVGGSDDAAVVARKQVA